MKRYIFFIFLLQQKLIFSSNNNNNIITKNTGIFLVGATITAGVVYAGWRYTNNIKRENARIAEENRNLRAEITKLGHDNRILLRQNNAVVQHLGGKHIDLIEKIKNDPDLGDTKKAGLLER